MAHVYMLCCSDGSFYVGSTRNLEHRVWQHNHPTEGAAYTRRRRPVRLIWSYECEHVGEAFALEKQIQNWGRAKRQALVDGRLTDLPGLARGRTVRPEAE